MFGLVCLDNFGDQGSSHPELFYKKGFFKIFAKFTIKHLCWSLFFQKQPPKVFCKKGVLKNFAKLTGKHLCQSLFSHKVVGLRPAKFIKKETMVQVFSCKFCEIFKCNVFTVHIWTTASVFLKNWLREEKKERL